MDAWQRSDQQLDLGQQAGRSEPGPAPPPLQQRRDHVADLGRIAPAADARQPLGEPLQRPRAPVAAATTARGWGATSGSPVGDAAALDDLGSRPPRARGVPLSPEARGTPCRREVVHPGVAPEPRGPARRVARRLVRTPLHRGRRYRAPPTIPLASRQFRVAESAVLRAPGPADSPTGTCRLAPGKLPTRGVGSWAAPSADEEPVGAVAVPGPAADLSRVRDPVGRHRHRLAAQLGGAADR